MRATLLIIAAELLAGWLGFQLGVERGMTLMENKRGRFRR